MLGKQFVFVILNVVMISLLLRVIKQWMDNLQKMYPPFTTFKHLVKTAVLKNDISK